MALLETVKLTKYFGGVGALLDVDMEIKEGEILGIIGPNGAGKTTLFNLLTGYYRPSSGKIIFKGRDIAALSPDRIANMGVVRTFQASMLFMEATVMENIIVAHHLQIKTGFFSALFNTSSHKLQEKELTQKALKIMEYVGLLPLKNELAKNLSHGHQRALGVAIALSADPVILLLDEPVTGMNPEEISFFMSSVKGLREKGITIAIVEHHVSAIVDVSDRIIVLDFGKKIAEGLPTEILANKDVVEAYLGTDADEE